MKFYVVDGTFPMGDGSTGSIDFLVEAADIKAAVEAATMIVEGIEDLDITIWSVTEMSGE